MCYKRLNRHDVFSISLINKFSDDVENLKQEMQKLKTAVAKPPVVKFKKANFMDWFPF